MRLQLRSAGIIGLFAAALAILTIFGWLIYTQHPATAVWESLFVTTLVLLIPLFVSSLAKRSEPFEPIYLVSVAYLLYFVYAPANDVLRGRLQYFGKNMSDLLPRGLLYAALGVLSMMLGYYAYRPMARLLARHLPVPAPARRRPTIYGRGLMAMAIVCFGAYVAASRMSLAQFLTLGQFGAPADASTLSAGDSPFRNYLASAVECFVPAFMILYAFSIVKRKWLAAGFVIILLIYATLGFRYRIMVFVLAPIVFRYLKLGRRPTAAALATAGVAAVLVIGGVGMLRTSFRSGAQIEREDLSIGRAQDTFTSSLAIYQPFLAMVDAIPANHDYFGWRPFTYVFLQPIPRAIWPDKPDAPVRDIVGAVFNGDAVQAGIAYPNIGEYYASFGVPGVIVGMLCFGLAMRTLYEYLLRYPDNDWIRLLYAITLPFLVQVVSRGYFVQIVQEAAFLVGPVFLGMWLVRRRARVEGRRLQGRPADTRDVQGLGSRAVTAP